MAGEIGYKAKNWRPAESTAGLPRLNRIQILADLYHPETGEFYRTAPIAETFVQDADKYAAEKNGLPWPPVPKEEEPCEEINEDLPAPRSWWQRVLDYFWG